MSRWVPFNLNKNVRVKLTAEGLAHLHREWMVYHKLFPEAFAVWKPPEIDKDGWSRWQLWQLIHEFGGSPMRMGAPNLFSLGIEFEVDE